MTFFCYLWAIIRNNMSRKNIVQALTVLTLLLFSSCGGKVKTSDQPPVIDTIPMMVMQIQKCAKLYTAEYQVHKIVTHDDQMKLKGTFLQKEFDITLPMGERKIAIPMTASLKAYIDFSGFSEKNIRKRGDKIEIILPDPKVEMTSSKINHKEIKRHVSLLRNNFSDEELSIYEKQGRAAIINDIPKMGIIHMAQENAANTLIPMIEQMGYPQDQITITFRKKYTISDLPALLDQKTFAR